MNLEKFRQLETKELENTYGGFWPLIAAFFTIALPRALNYVAQAASTFKMISSDNGSLKTKEFESHWSDNKEVKEKESKTSRESVKQIVYAY